MGGPTTDKQKKVLCEEGETLLQEGENPRNSTHRVITLPGLPPAGRGLWKIASRLVSGETTQRWVASIVLAPLLLSGCVMAEWEQAINDTIAQALPSEIVELLESTTDVPLDTPISTDIPTSWPEAVSIPSGDILFSLAEPGTWNIAVVVPEPADASRALRQLQDNGFAVVSEQSLRGLSVVELTDGTYDVSFASIAEGSQTVVNITVTMPQAN